MLPVCLFVLNYLYIFLNFYIPYSNIYNFSLAKYNHTCTQKMTYAVISRCAEASCLTSCCSPRVIQVSWVLRVTSACPMQISMVHYSIKTIHTVCSNNWMLSSPITLIYYFILYYYVLLLYCIMEVNLIPHAFLQWSLSEILCSCNILFMFLSKYTQVMLTAENNPVWKLAISYCYFSEMNKQSRQQLCHLSVR